MDSFEFYVKTNKFMNLHRQKKLTIQSGKKGFPVHLDCMIFVLTNAFNYILIYFVSFGQSKVFSAPCNDNSRVIRVSFPSLEIT